MKKQYSILAFYLSALIMLSAQPPSPGGNWQQKPCFPDGRERAFSFIVGDKMYVGGGRNEISLSNASTSVNSCYAFDFTEEQWIAIAEPSGPAIRNSSGFALNGYGYKVGGWDGLSGESVKTFFRYDPAADSWEQLADFPGQARSFASSFVIDDKAYLACGGDNPYINELWSYDANTAEWTQLADMPGIGRWMPFSFVIDGKGYVGGGGNNILGTSYTDFYEYDPITNTWLQLADFPNAHSNGCFSFALNDKGYVGEGGTSGWADTRPFVWQYDPATNIWAEATSFRGTASGRMLTFSESYNGKGYVGGGRYHGANQWYFFDDFWAFDPGIDSEDELYENWETYDTGIEHDDHLEFFGVHMVDTQTVWAATYNIDYQNQPQFFVKTTDGGQTWTQGTFGDVIDNYLPFQIFALDDQTAFVPAVEFNGFTGNLYKTIDGGDTWYPIDADFANTSSCLMLALHFFDENDGWGFCLNPNNSSIRFYVTEDGGESWAESNYDSPTSNSYIEPWSGNGCFSVIGDSIWIGDSDGDIWRSTDRGHNWELFSNSLGNNPIHGVAFKDAQNGLAVGNSFFSTSYQNRAALTTDGGLTWSNIPIPDFPMANAIIHVPNTNGTFIVYDGWMTTTKTLLTEDFGATWQTIDMGPAMGCLDFLDGQHGWAVGSIAYPNKGGLYKWTGDYGSISTATKNILAKSQLDFLTYPNPADSRLYIRNSNAIDIEQVTVTNPLGQIIKSFPIKSNDALIQLDVTNIPNGLFQFNIVESTSRLSASKNILIHH